jgi:hypothetical protein
MPRKANPKRKVTENARSKKSGRTAAGKVAAKPKAGSRQSSKSARAGQPRAATKKATPGSKVTGRKTSAKATAKKTAVKKTVADKASARKGSSRKAAERRTERKTERKSEKVVKKKTGKKSSARKSPVKKSLPKKAVAKKSVAKRAAVKKSTATSKRASSTKTASGRGTKKALSKKPQAKKVAAKKTVAKKTAAKKTGQKPATRKSASKTVPPKKVSVRKPVTGKVKKSKTSPVKRGASKTANTSPEVQKASSEQALAKKVSVTRQGKKEAGSATISAKRESKVAALLGTEERPPMLPSPSLAELKSFRKETERRKKLVEGRRNARAARQRFLAKEPRKGRKYSVDLRIHSPGTVGYFAAGGVEPGPALVRLSRAKGLDVIGVTDYFDASAVDSLQESARESTLTILPGLDLRVEVAGCNDVFLTVLFPEEKTSVDLYAVLTRLEVPASQRGNRDYCLDKSLAEVLRVVEEAGGVAIPSRLDKTPYRQLAIAELVERYGFHAFDVAHPENTDYFKSRWPGGEFTFFCFSNAHALAQIGSRISRIRLAEPGFAGIFERVKRRIPERREDGISADSDAGKGESGAAHAG